MRRKQIIFSVGNAVPSVPCTNLRSVCCGTSKQIIFSVGNVVLDVPCRILRSGILRNAEDSVPYKSECIFTLASVFLHFDKGRFGAELAECLAIRRKQIVFLFSVLFLLRQFAKAHENAFLRESGIRCNLRISKVHFWGTGSRLPP